MKINKKPLLTVAIPTYKRPETLERIVKQLYKESDQNFTLLISDDSVDDNTEIMIEKYSKKMPNIIYSKNKKNLGFSGNVVRLYELAKTRYIWFLCDDDSIVPGAVESIITALNKYKPIVAVFNAVWTDSFGRERVAGVTKDTIYEDLDMLHRYDPLMRTTFLSIVVVEKRIAIDKIKKKEYKDNIFVQVTLSLQLLSDKFKYCEIASTIVKRNVGYKYGEFFKFYTVDHLKAVSLVKHDFENKKFISWSIKHLPTALQLYLSQKIGLFKYTGAPSIKTILNIMKFYRLFSFFMPAFVIIYYLTPSVLIKYVYRLKLEKYHGHNKARSIYDQNINRAKTDKRKTGFTQYR